MKAALEDTPIVDFRVPKGLKLIPINAKTGLETAATGEGVIMEAFKPGTAPPTIYSVIGFEDMVGAEGLTVSPEANRALTSGTGGLY